MATSVQTRPRWFLLPNSHATAAPPPSNPAWLAPTLVLLAALVLAGCLYVRFLNVERALWYNPYHDRSAHYLYSLKLATDVQNGRLLRLLHDLNEAKVWPPLHGMAAATVLLIGGRDHRLAVLPSLAGWVATILLGFLVARRASPRGGTLAGLVAALFIAASPAHRAYAADIMLESLGAALSLLALYCYLLTVQGRAEETGKARCLAVSLLLLFLEKYNYWLLVVLALLAAEGFSRPRLYVEAIRNLLRGIDWRRWTATQLRHPLTWAVVFLLLASAYVYQHGEPPFHVLGHSISLHPPHNVIHLAYVLLFLRLAPWWWRQGRLWTRQLDNRLRQILLWLVCPISVWFLLPKHLSYFVWYLSLADRAPHQQMDVLGGFRDYAIWMVQDYHYSPACALAAAGLCLLGLLSWRRLRPGGIAVLALVLLAGVLTPTHPNHKGRMLHSWIPAVWVTAGLGAATLWAPKKRTTETQKNRARSVSEGCLGALTQPRLPSLTLRALLLFLLCVLCVSVVNSSSLLGHAVEGGPHPEQLSMLDVTDAYLGDLDRGGRTIVLTSLPLKPMAQWTWLEHFGSFEGLEERWYGFGAPGVDNRGGFADWLRTTDCDTLVFCESTIPRPGVDSGPECALHAELKEVLSGQQSFCLVRQHELPHLACRVQLWRRKIDISHK
ncbi:MAG TPA: hypothetical protein VMG10_11530 [Gemmataceae bacterium]|nr:hypothetical protein [Gemmataceae bacterium]